MTSSPTQPSRRGFPAVGALTSTTGERRELRDTRTPVLFVSYGSPLASAEEDFKQALRRFGVHTRLPKQVLVVSANWHGVRPIRVTGSAQPDTMKDFEGFPSYLSSFTYRCPGDPGLAKRLVSILKDAGVDAAVDPVRGLDSAVWGPLSVIYPSARVPVLQLSLPAPIAPREMVSLGRVLAPLRREGVLLVGSGGVVHNVSRARFDTRTASTETWATAFDSWMAGRIEAMDVEAICEYRTKGPSPHLAAPTSAHLDPLFFALGAALPGDVVTWIFEGFHAANLSLRSFTLAGQRSDDRRLPDHLSFQASP